LQNGKFNRVSKTTQITNKKQIVDAGDLHVYY